MIGESAHHSPVRILQIEDNPADARLICELLADCVDLSVMIHCESTFAGGCAYLDANQVDIVLLDLGLPDSSGLETLVKMSEKFSALPTVILTGLDDDLMSVEALRHGAQDYIGKNDMNPRMLRRVIRYAIERKQLEQVIVFAAEEWKSTFDAVSDSICLLDRESRIIRCNKATAALARKTISEILGQKCWEVFHGADTPYPNCPFERAARSKRMEFSEICLGNRWYEVTVDPIFDKQGELVSAVHVLREITERKLYETERGRLLSMLEATLNELYVFEPDTLHFVYVNRSAIDNLGFSMNQLKVMTPLDLKPEFTLESFNELIAPLRSREKPVIRFETFHRRSDGTRYPVEVHLQMVDAHSGESLFLAVIHDGTQRKESEKEQKRNYERLELMQEVNQYHASNVQGLLDFALEKVIELTESSIGYIYHYHEEEQQFVLNTWSKNVMEACSIAEPQSVYELVKTGIWGEVVRQRKPIVVNDCSASNPLKRGYPEGHVHMSRFLSIPVIDNDKIVAVVGVANKALPYDQSDLLQLTLMMDGVWKIVRRFEIEESLRENQEQFSLFMKYSPIYCFIKEITETESRVLQASDNFIDMIGIPSAEMIGKTMDQIFPVEFADRITADDLHVVHTKEVVRLEENLHGRNYITYKFPIETRYGRKLLAGYTLDVSDLKEAETAILKSRALLNTTAEAANMGGWEIDLKTQKLIWTDQIYRIYEVETDFQPTVETTIAFYAPESLPVISEAVQRAIEHGEPFDLELYFITAKGNRRLVHAVGQAQFQDDKPVKVFGTFQDITEKRQAEQALRDAQAQLIQKEKLATIGQMAAGIAHEINNPVGFMRSNLASLEKYADKLLSYLKLERELVECHINEEYRSGLTAQWKSNKLDFIIEDLPDLIHESQEGAERVKKTVSDLMSFARRDSAGEMKQVDLNTCIAGIINIAWNEIKQVAELKRELGEIPPVKGESHRLAQVFLNLLVNASHAVGDHGVITVRSWYENEEVCVSVADNGKGIPEDVLPHIFEPFFTTKEAGKGTGLGLSISRDIVVKHGGKLGVASEPGVGTTFTVRLPVYKGQAGETSDE